jgi:hypothetical protein
MIQGVTYMTCVIYSTVNAIDGIKNCTIAQVIPVILAFFTCNTYIYRIVKIMNDAKVIHAFESSPDNIKRRVERYPRKWTDHMMYEVELDSEEPHDPNDQTDDIDTTDVDRTDANRKINANSNPNTRKCGTNIVVGHELLDVALQSSIASFEISSVLFVVYVIRQSIVSEHCHVVYALVLGYVGFGAGFIILIGVISLFYYPSKDHLSWNQLRFSAVTWSFVVSFMIVSHLRRESRSIVIYESITYDVFHVLCWSIPYFADVIRPAMMRDDRDETYEDDIFDACMMFEIDTQNSSDHNWKVMLAFIIDNGREDTYSEYVLDLNCMWFLRKYVQLNVHSMKFNGRIWSNEDPRYEMERRAIMFDLWDTYIREDPSKEKSSESKFTCDKRIDFEEIRPAIREFDTIFRRIIDTENDPNTEDMRMAIRHFAHMINGITDRMNRKIMNKLSRSRHASRMNTFVNKRNTTSRRTHHVE